MSARPEEPRLEMHCLDRRCGTLLPRDAEICDECGGTRLGRVGHSDAILLGDAGDRPVAFGLTSVRPNLLGRASPDLDVDLGHWVGAESVHRHHAQIVANTSEGTWSVTHLGRNPLVIFGPAGAEPVQPGTTRQLRSGDWLQVGRIRLRFMVGRRAGTQG
ncbi:MAG TPA: FHA domain-containing protein [Chloroflexota bacterium]